MGLRGLSFGPERADFGFERADFGLERADLGPERGLGGGRTDVWTSGNSPLCPTGHWPFGAAAQKRNFKILSQSAPSCFLNVFVQIMENGYP